MVLEPFCCRAPKLLGTAKNTENRNLKIEDEKMEAEILF
jgi:hypothetical protein